MEQGEIILYQPNDSLRLEVRLDGDNVWLNRSQLAELFDLSGMEKNAERLKKNAKRQADAAKAAQSRLKMLKAQKQLRDATRDTSSESRF